MANAAPVDLRIVHMGLFQGCARLSVTAEHRLLFHNKYNGIVLSRLFQR